MAGLLSILKPQIIMIIEYKAQRRQSVMGRTSAGQEEIKINTCGLAGVMR